MKYVIDEWKLDGDLIIHGRITEIGATWTLKRGAYNSDAITGTMRMQPDNLKCHIVVRKPEAEILAAGDDLGIAGAVLRRFSHELNLTTHQLIVEHIGRVYPDPEPEGARVSAGERTVKRETESVEF